MGKRQAATLCVLSIIVLVLGFLVSRRVWFRVDLTREKAHTISAVSRNLRNEIPPGDQIRITYYVSGRLASLDPMPGEIEDLLREYTSWSRGTIHLTLRDPAKTNTAAEVERLGVAPQQIQTVEQDQASVATVYTGIVIEYLDQIEVLPVVFSLDTLEYDITSRIHSMLRGTERQIGVLVGDGYRQWNTNYQPLAQALNRSAYRARLIEAGEEIPAALPALLVLGGVEDLDHWSLYRIDYYIRNGGKVLFALEGVHVDIEGNLEARVMLDKGLLAMVSFYGATIQPELTLDRSARTLQYYMQAPNGSVQPRIVRYPHWFGILRENANRTHPVTASFSGLDLFWPSHISLNPPSGVEAETLFASTPEAWVFSDSFITNPEMVNQMETAESRGQRVLGVSLSGNFPSRFEGVAKPEREGATEELPDLPPRAATSRLIVVADTDMATDLLNYTGAGYNPDFFIKALDWLGNDDELMEIHSRSSRIGRMDKITDPVRKFRIMGFAQTFNVIFLPLALIGAGILFAWNRRKNNARNEGHGNGV
ncbi:MAG: GldG family protein [Treponema sp.]|jgi:ABC-type uncharacterized transport system involved in gliding motility auxiliary subunit|nr:GldG family protein [Treponema sp.]